MTERSNFDGLDGLDGLEGLEGLEGLDVGKENDFTYFDEREASREISNVLKKSDKTAQLWEKMSNVLDDKFFSLVVEIMYQYEEDVVDFLLECLISAKNKSEEDFEKVLEILRKENVVSVFNSCAQTRRNSTVAVLVGLIIADEIEGFRRALNKIEEDYINRAL